MNPAHPSTIKQNLNKAYQLFQPKPAAIERFKTNLFSLISQLRPEGNEEEVKEYLATMLQGTYLEFTSKEPHNSSPVCYATVSGLREGFENSSLTGLETKPKLNNNALPANSQTPGKITLDHNLKEALHLTKVSVQAMLTANTTNSPADTITLEKRINELVYQVYELTPEEIIMVEAG